MNSLSLIFTVITVAVFAVQTSLQVNSSASVYSEDPNIIFPYVKCPAGNFFGRILTSRLGRWYNEFRGIPFAQNPKRFEPSVLAKPLEALYDARNHKAACPQPGLAAVSEDCLFLNVAYPHKD
ncbi:unnamed protein product, partial [Allacma fusca]